MKHVLIIGNGLGQLAKQISEYTTCKKDTEVSCGAMCESAEELGVFVKQTKELGDKAMNNVGRSTTDILNRVAEALNNCDNIPCILIKKGDINVQMLNAQGDIIASVISNGQNYTDAERQKFKEIVENLRYLGAVCAGLNSAVKQTAAEMKTVVAKREAYEKAWKLRTPITNDEKLDCLIKDKNQYIDILDDQIALINVYIGRLKEVARRIEGSGNVWALKVLALKSKIDQLENMAEETDLARAATIENKRRLITLKGKREIKDKLKMNSELLSTLNAIKKDAGEGKKCDCGGECAEKCDCHTEGHKSSVCETLSEINETIKKLRELNSEVGSGNMGKSPIEVAITEANEKAKKLKEKATDVVGNAASAVEDAISKAKEALEDVKNNEVLKKDEAHQEDGKSAATDLFSNYFGCAFGESLMSVADIANLFNGPRCSKFEKELDYCLGKALTMLDNGDKKGVEEAILSIKSTLNKYSKLFNAKQLQDAEGEKAVKVENPKSRFGVVVSYSFDDTVRVMTAETYEEAYEYMQKDFYHEQRIDVEENGYKISSETEITPTKAVLATIYRSSEVGYTYWNLVSLNDIKASK